MPILELSVGDALTAMTGGLDGPPALALNMDFALNEHGQVDFRQLVSAPQTAWEDWVNLPIRSEFRELQFDTSMGPMRAPTVIVQQHFAKNPMKTLRLSRRAIWERDCGMNQYDGQSLRYEDANLDHVIPRSLGGETSWENLVLTSKKMNSWKGNKRNEEIGLKLIKQPTVPKSRPAAFMINHIAHPSWIPFLLKAKL